jgi:hypothetical protein
LGGISSHAGPIGFFQPENHERRETDLEGQCESDAILLAIIGDLLSDAIPGGGNDNGAANDPV